jgi:lipopolysaccharide transport system permease protein
MDIAAANSGRKPAVVIKSSKGFFQLDLKSVWQYREMLFFLVWRDVILRYKQTAIGAAWVVLQPTINMIIFTVIFSRLARIPSDGIPYPVFAFSALLPWAYFSQALARSSSSVVVNSNLVTKIYFPRILIPLAASIAPAVDLFFSFLILLVLLAWYHIQLTAGILTLPLFLGLAIMTALAVGLWSSALNVKYRDVGNIIPFMIQIWMYASPVIYPVSMIPVKWRLLYSLNPMVGVIEGFRWALLGKQSPDYAVMAVSATVVTALLAGGVVYFKKVERTFADVI